MPEPLIHFVIPFTFLIIMGVRSKKAFLASLIALTPDLDALVGIHSSTTPLHNRHHNSISTPHHPKS